MKVFYYQCIVLLFLIPTKTYCQNNLIKNETIVIDTNLLAERWVKSIKYYKLDTLKDLDLLKKKEYSHLYFYCREVFKNSFYDYSIFEVGITVSHTPVYYCVYNSKDFTFIDNISYNDFNLIVKSCKFNLNNYDKAVLYTIFVNQESLQYFTVSKYIKKNTYYEKPLYIGNQTLKEFICKDLSEDYYYVPKIIKNKDILKLFENKNPLVLCLPHIFPTSNSKKLSFYNFYFTENGELFKSNLVKDYFDLD